jgi:hypothetical protein
MRLFFKKLFGVESAEAVILNKFRKIQDRYILPHDLVKLYLENNKLVADAREKAKQFYTVKYSFGSIDVERLIDEFTYAEIARKKGNYLSYAFHSNQQMEKILGLFCFYKPGTTVLVNKLNLVVKPSKDLTDILFGTKPGFNKGTFLSNFANSNRIDDLADKKTLFEHFLYRDKTHSIAGTIVPGAEACPFYNLNFFQILRYFRNAKTHPDAKKPKATDAFTMGYLNAPDMLLSTNHVSELINAYSYLYTEYLRGNIVI